MLRLDAIRTTAVVEGVLRRPLEGSSARPHQGTDPCQGEEMEVKFSTQTLEDDALTGIAKLRFVLPDVEAPAPPPLGGPPPPPQRRFSTYAGALEAAARKAEETAAEAAAREAAEAAEAAAAAELDETLGVDVDAPSADASANRSAAVGSDDDDEAIPTQIPSLPTRSAHFGPIVSEFGFLWRSFVFLEDGFLSAGLEKLGPDPHLEFSVAQQLDPEIDPFLWSQNHEEKHEIIRSINREKVEPLIASVAVKRTAVEGAQWSAISLAAAAIAAATASTLGQWNGAIVTSGGFIWRIEFPKGKKILSAAAAATVAKKDKGEASTSGRTGKFTGEAGVQLKKLGVDPNPHCDCLRRKTKTSVPIDAAITGGGGGREKEEGVGRLSKSFDSKQVVGFHKSSDKRSLPSNKSNRTKSSKKRSIFKASKQDTKPFACCYCDDDKHFQRASIDNPNVQICIGTHDTSATSNPPPFGEGTEGGNGPGSASRSESRSTERSAPGSGRGIDILIGGEEEAPPEGGRMVQRVERDFLVDPLTQLDVRIYLTRYPPKGYKDPEPILYLVKTIQGVGFPTVVRRVPKDGVAVYDVKRKRRNDDPKVIWVRRPSPPATSDGEIRNNHSSAEVGEAQPNATTNNDNGENDDDSDDDERSVSRWRISFRASINSWGIKRLCKIDCLRNPEKGYRDEEKRVEIIFKFGPAKENSMSSEKKEIAFRQDEGNDNSGAHEKPLEKWWWWRRETSMLMEMEKQEERKREEEERRKERERRENEAQNELKELVSVRSRDRAPSTERVVLPDNRVVRPWWRKKEATSSETETKEDEKPVRRRWAPGMKFDEQGCLTASFPAESGQRRRSSDWNAPKGLWRRRLETRPAERRRFSPSSFHDYGAIGKQEAQMLKNAAVASGFLKPRERAMAEAMAFD